MWVKMRGELVDSPKVRKAARQILKSDIATSAMLNDKGWPTIETVRLVLIGALTKFWSVAAELGHFHETDLILEGYTRSDIDEVAGVIGFADAMIEVNWLRPGALSNQWFLPHFREHNGDPTAPPKVSRKKTAPKPKAERPRNLLFDAIVEVTGADVTLKRQAEIVGTVTADLKKANPPYTPDEVRDFGKRFREVCTYAANESRLPTPWEIEKHIHKIRLKPKKVVSEWRPPQERDAATSPAQGASEPG